MPKENDAIVKGLRELSDQIHQLGQIILGLKNALPGVIEMNNLTEALKEIAKK